MTGENDEFAATSMLHFHHSPRSFILTLETNSANIQGRIDS
jgi:hypothetical protein